MEDLKDLRLGERRQNTYGSWMTIIEYNSYANITVSFDTGYQSFHKTYDSFCKGKIKDPFFPHVWGVGYIGIGNHKIKEGKKNTVAYAKWSSMLDRCYSDKMDNRNFVYKDCKVCEEWLCYQTFADWIDENYYEIPGQIMCLDKDILEKNNKIYCPEKCCIVPNDINSMLVTSKRTRGIYPIGIHKKKENYKYNVQIYNNNKTLYLGNYNSIEEAFNVYKEKKEELIKERAEKYKKYLPSKVYNALLNYKIEITD